jgi:limonene-1,2-epoxide hydrolase
MSSLDILLRLIERWKARDIDGVLALMDENIVWHYAAAIAPPVRGKAKARRLLETLSPQIAEVRWRIFDYAERDNRLFVEGVDEYVATDGRLVSAPYAGVVEIADGRITALREYFDLGLVNSLKAGESAPEHVRLLLQRPALAL